MSDTNTFLQKKSCCFWQNYWGLLTKESVRSEKFEIYGFENISSANRDKRHFSFDKSGTLWGFVLQGSLQANSSTLSWNVSPGQWFCLPFKGGGSIAADKDTRVFILFYKDHYGLSSMGGPVEHVGRLQYIDGCTDTLLYSPPTIGEPCLNLLHFPAGVNQTTHYHPSFRAGIVNQGQGICVTGESYPLAIGTIFYLPASTRHKFQTNDRSMDVISFHPDSDWGPTHEVHPMINRTWGRDD